MKIKTTVSCPIDKTFLVSKAAGMFDLDVGKKSTETFEVELPDVSDDWQIGAIVGPSGSGKSSVAREAYKRSLYNAGTGWPKAKSVLDGFGIKDIRQITQSLTSVGFSSPPAWVRPYQVLSNGEKFRCDLAKALLTAKDLCVFDEFTSVVDRTVAQIGSAAMAKAVRRGEKKFVAVSCHYDILEWLQPDWTLDMATCQLARGCLQRPEINLRIYRCHRKAWKLFARHHYLNTSDIPPSSRCYVALLNDTTPVALCSMMSWYGGKKHWRLSRTVVLPDYQGVGIGVLVSEGLAQQYVDAGNRVTTQTAHPAMIAHRARSRKWRTRRVKKHGIKATGIAREVRHNTCGAARATVCFEYVGSEGVKP